MQAQAPLKMNHSAFESIIRSYPANRKMQKCPKGFTKINTGYFIRQKTKRALNEADIYVQSTVKDCKIFFHQK